MTHGWIGPHSFTVLVQVLREAKEKKEQDFADKWKQMKTGVLQSVGSIAVSVISNDSFACQDVSTLPCPALPWLRQARTGP